MASQEESMVVDLSEASRSYLFGPSMVTVSRIREMASLCYFADGDAQAPGEEVFWSLQMRKLWCWRKFLRPGFICLLSMRSLRFCSSSG
jgi:hypothetical protein